MIEGYFAPFAALKESIDDSFYNVYDDSPPAVHLAKNIMRSIMWGIAALCFMAVYLILWAICDMILGDHRVRATLLSIPVTIVVYTIVWAVYTLDNA